MCYAKPGNRCAGYETMRRNKLTKQLAEAEQADAELRQQIRDIHDAGGSTGRLKERLKRIIDQTQALKVASENAEKDWLKTKDGIAHLRELAADEALPSDMRELYRLKADRYAADAAKALSAVRVSKAREVSLHETLAAAGVSEEAIQQVMKLKAETTFGSSVVSSSTAKNNWKQAQKKFDAITKEARDAEVAAQKSGTPEEVEAVVHKYSTLRAEAKERLDMNTAAYYTTPAGIQEFRDAAAAATKRSEKEYNRQLADSWQRVRDSKLEGNNLRRRREAAIREAMLSVGKDPTDAIDAYRAARKEKHLFGRPDKAPALRSNASATTMITASEYNDLEREAGTHGTSVAALIRIRALASPTDYMDGHASEVIAAVPAKPKKTGHRNTTVLGERREQAVNVTLTHQEKTKLRLRAKTYGMSVSSYMEKMALKQDVRQIQNDRSDIVNTVKSEAMNRKHATPAMSARNLVA